MLSTILRKSCSGSSSLVLRRGSGAVFNAIDSLLQSPSPVGSYGGSAAGVTGNGGFGGGGRCFAVAKSGPFDFRASYASQAGFAAESKTSVDDDGLDIAGLGMDKSIVSALASRGIHKLFPIQRAVLEPAMQGRDMIGRARTGTGKTLAFGMPILDKIIQFNAKHGRGRNPLALVMAPTRELASQVEKEFRLTAPNLDTICCYGGSPIGSQIRSLNYGVDVVVGTPGRLIDLLKRGALNLSEVQFVVLDEADQMLAVGFEEAVESILQQLPQKRQSMMFSATMPPPIRKLTRKYLKDPLIIDLVGEDDQKLAEGISLYSIVSDNYAKASILGPLITEHAKGGKCIIFTQTKRDADRLSYAMAGKYKCDVSVLSTDSTQLKKSRSASFKRIRSRIAFFVENLTSEKGSFSESKKELTRLIVQANDLRFARTTKTTNSLFPFLGAPFFFLKNELGGVRRRIPDGSNRYLNAVESMEDLLSNRTNSNTLIKSVKIRSIYQSASMIAQEISLRLKKLRKGSFRRTYTHFAHNIPVVMKKRVLGIRISCSGRLRGKPIASTFCGKYGKTSGNVFNQKIDYAFRKVSTRYGILGVKVWISLDNSKKRNSTTSFLQSALNLPQAPHGDIAQNQRERTLAGFREGHFNILIATDDAARGLDIPNVDLVIHYDLPNTSEIFVHRSGRTGRAGKKGSAILIYSDQQARDVRIIEQEIGSRFTQLPRIEVRSEDMLDVGGGGGGFRSGSFGGGQRSSDFGRSSGGNGGFGHSSGFGGSGSGVGKGRD